MTFAHSVAPFVLLPFDLEGRSVGRSVRGSKNPHIEGTGDAREKGGERSRGNFRWGILIKGFLDASERPVFVCACLYISLLTIISAACACLDLNFTQLLILSYVYIVINLRVFSVPVLFPPAIPRQQCLCTEMTRACVADLQVSPKGSPRV